MLKKKMMPQYTRDNIEISFDSHSEDFDEEILMKKVLMKNILMKKIKYRMFFFSSKAIRMILSCSQNTHIIYIIFKDYKNTNKILFIILFSIYI